MPNIADVVELKPNERVYGIVRRHAVTLWPRLAFAAVFLVIPFFFLFPLLRWNVFGPVLFAGLEALGLLLAVRAFLMWDATVFVITSHRACHVHQLGLWKRRVVDTPLAFVRAVEMERRGPWQALLGTGSIMLVTSADADGVLTTQVPNPERVQSLLNHVREKRAWQAPIGGETVDAVTVTSPSPLARIADLMDQADEATLLEVERILQERAEH